MLILWLQVRKRPLNKKELAKNEEDIIETHSNCLTVHETKLKVNLNYGHFGDTDTVENLLLFIAVSMVM